MIKKVKWKKRTVILPDWRTVGDRQVSYFFGDFEGGLAEEVKIPFLRIEFANTLRKQRQVPVIGYLDSEGFACFEGKRFLPETDEEKEEWALGMCQAFVYRTDFCQVRWSGIEREWGYVEKIGTQFQALSEIMRASTIPGVSTVFFLLSKTVRFDDWRK